MITKKSIDKVAKLWDLLDKHIKEKNCRHNARDLLGEYEKLTSIKYRIKVFVHHVK